MADTNFLANAATGPESPLDRQRQDRAALVLAVPLNP
jgi:hypothetical protein